MGNMLATIYLHTHSSDTNQSYPILVVRVSDHIKAGIHLSIQLYFSFHQVLTASVQH